MVAMLLRTGHHNHPNQGSQIPCWSESVPNGEGNSTMALAPARQSALLRCDGFAVVTAEARVGSVEEIWLDSRGEPTGLAIRTGAGERGLVLADDVAAVDQERRWVVVDPDVRVLELEPPRLVQGVHGSRRFEAAWTTSGDTLAVRPPPRARVRRPQQARPDPPLVRSIVLLYAALTVVVALIMALAFLVPYLVV
jgi:hypothetical protein